jgi:hypothetical protein
MLEVLDIRAKVASLEKGKNRQRRRKGRRTLCCRTKGLEGVGAMTRHSKRDEADGTIAAQRSSGARPIFPNKLPTSANDNDCEGPWPLIPFPEGLNGLHGEGRWARSRMQL